MALQVCNRANTTELIQVDVRCASVYTAEIGFNYIEAEEADEILLRCNSSESSELKWTHRPTHENRTYVYMHGNGTTDGRYGTEQRYSFVTSVKDEFILRIYNALQEDSGRFDCYDSGNVRRAGYELNVTGELISV